MKDLADLLETADKLIKSLERAAMQDKAFCAELCLKFEVMSWEAWRTTNDLREAINYYGVNHG